MLFLLSLDFTFSFFNLKLLHLPQTLVLVILSFLFVDSLLAASFANIDLSLFFLCSAGTLVISRALEVVVGTSSNDELIGFLAAAFRQHLLYLEARFAGFEQDFNCTKPYC